MDDNIRLKGSAAPMTTKTRTHAEYTVSRRPEQLTNAVSPSERFDCLWTSGVQRGETND